MVYEALCKYCVEKNESPREPDISRYLEILEWMVNYRRNGGELSKEKPFQVQLEKYKDEPGFYCINDSIPELGIHQHTNPMPFKDENDGEALERLHSKLQEFNKKYPKPIFSVGGIIEGVHGANGLLRKMAENPRNAHIMSEELAEEYSWKYPFGLSGDTQ